MTLNRNPITIIWPLKPNRQEIAQLRRRTAIAIPKQAKDIATAVRSDVSHVGLFLGIPMDVTVVVSSAEAGS
jgi:hypothetical protein